MESILTSLITGLVLEQAQHFGNLSIIPVLSSAPEGPEYLTLAEALRTGVIEISELDEAGAVPELRVINSGDIPVLILSGEELMGAKQNRVL
ncbi:MAG TPA: hypothetical protein PLP42_22975, partial [Acidobacteriota bacterium]|nr:hypothetical protein [Acidobacteriota bacterium]